MAACSDSGQAQCPKGSIPISVPAPVLKAAAGDVPGRRSWSLVLHRRVSHRLHRLGGKSLNLCLPALKEGRSLFSQCCAKHKVLFYFSSCPGHCLILASFPKVLFILILGSSSMAYFSSPGASSTKAAGKKQALWQAGCWAPVRRFCPCHFTALCPGATACRALGCGSASVCGDLPEQEPGLAEKNVPVRLPGRWTQGHGERRRKGTHTATGDYPCYGYVSIAGQPPFSLGKRNVYFEKFNMIFSGPDYFKNSILTVVDGQVLKHITEALFRIYELQSLVLEEGAESVGQAIGLWSLTIAPTHLKHLWPPKPLIISQGLAFYLCS